MTHIERDMEIHCSPAQLFGLLVDYRRAPEWITPVQAMDKLTDGPVGIGTRFSQRVRILGRTLDGEWHVTEYDEPRRFAMRGEAPGGIHATFTHVIEETSDGCRDRFSMDYEMPGGMLGRITDRTFAERRNEREMQTALENLKDILESEAGGAG